MNKFLFKNSLTSTSSWLKPSYNWLISNVPISSLSKCLYESSKLSPYSYNSDDTFCKTSSLINSTSCNISFTLFVIYSIFRSLLSFFPSPNPKALCSFGKSLYFIFIYSFIKVCKCFSLIKFLSPPAIFISLCFKSPFLSFYNFSNIFWRVYSSSKNISSCILDLI